MSSAHCIICEINKQQIKHNKNDNKVDKSQLVSKKQNVYEDEYTK